MKRLLSVMSCFATLVLWNGLGWAQTRTPVHFRNLSIEHGLSQSTATCFLQDRTGFLWFGTADGLNRYDGYGFKVFRRDGRQPDSLAGNLVYAVCEDHTGVLWVGTSEGGLSRYDARTERFTRYAHHPDQPTSLYGGQVRSLCADRQGQLWIGTSEGLCRLDRERRHITRFPSADTQTPQALLGKRVLSLALDHAGRLWAGTSQGLSCYDPETGQFTHYRHNPAQPGTLGEGSVRALHVGRSGILWVGTQGGLCQFLPETGQFRRLSLDPRLASRSGSHAILSIYEDSLGTLWVGTYTAGLYRFNGGTQTFERVPVVSSETASLGGDRIWCIGEDSAQGLWIGTETGGVNCLSLRPRAFTSHLVYQPSRKQLSRRNVWAFAEDRDGNWWIGTEDGLLWHDRIADRQIPIPLPAQPLNGSCRVNALQIDSDNNLWVSYEQGLARVDGRTRRARPVPLAKELPADDILALALVASDQLWLGTPEGIYVIEPATGKTKTHFQPAPTSPTGLSAPLPWMIQRDRRGNVWVSSNRGLSRFESATQSITRFGCNPQDVNSLPTNEINAVHEDRRGQLWVATNGGGLCQLDPAGGQCVAYTTRDGLANDIVYGILEDDAGDLWLSTNHGLSRFSPDTKTFRNFDAQDGLQSNEFNSNAFFRTSTGAMLFGGIAGYTVFHPAHIFENQTPPPVIITGFRQLDQPESRPVPDDLALTYDANNFAFEFTALNYVNSEKNRYAYRLEGYDKGWIQAGTQRFASYTNLAPGAYVFRVRAANDAGVWNERGAALRLRIMPPPWKTWWAYTLYALAGAALLTIAFRFQMGRLRERAALTEARIRAEAAVQLEARNHELSRMNDELAQVNRELAQANDDLEQANQNLVASQQQADRIFSALAEALPGTTLDGKYHLEVKIGAGGFGVVFRARHLALNRPIAVKVFRPSSSNDSAEAIERFKREGVSASRLTHPHIVTVFDSGVSTDGIAYLAMELLIGHSLKDELRQRLRLALGEAMGIARDVADALTEAHRLGVIHRDIKPENIFLHQSTAGQVVKVVDFGIAKLTNADGQGPDAKLTQTGGLLGTPVYMSPEGIEGGTLDGRTDVYSLGILLFEMITGEPPFPSAKGHFWQVINAHLKTIPPRLHDLSPDVPPALSDLVARMLTKDPLRRPSAQEVKEQLTSLQATRPVVTTRPARPTHLAQPDTAHDTADLPTWLAPGEDGVG
ncbi:protein kinase [Chloracidobacterium validum]|uniref:Protein kinase n=1 Tax=Chloracidobacterium validum TaxID=2821543 RepID=A0ABX8BAG7_9BACT|nr:two-component regulator propeller domain-containing protein [Chloracidobacterium validum]QUW03661.1 protein kinase [Chloracidobacterium validum]